MSWTAGSPRPGHIAHDVRIQFAPWATWHSAGQDRACAGGVSQQESFCLQGTTVSLHALSPAPSAITSGPAGAQRHQTALSGPCPKAGLIQVKDHCRHEQQCCRRYTGAHPMPTDAVGTSAPQAGHVRQEAAQGERGNSSAAPVKPNRVQSGQTGPAACAVPSKSRT